MKFRTEFDIKRLPDPLTHRHRLLLMGSCFTENIGQKLDRFKFTTLQNPHGILFNPVSVAEALTDAIENRRYDAADLFQLNEAWHSWRHHSRFSALQPEEALGKMNESVQRAHQFLKEADCLFLTLGSAWVYALTEKATGGRTGRVAANNHKAPADWFHRRLLSSEEVLRHLDNVMHRLFLFNPKLRILFTISPVRHLREGAVENNRSKAVLIQAVHHLVDKFDRLFYFPAYELVIDDLRDYRFYAEDLVHPNYLATQYVWERFVDACMAGGTKALMAQLQELQTAYQHKPIHPQSAAHQSFKAKYRQFAQEMQQRHPYLNLEEEINHFSS